MQQTVLRMIREDGERFVWLEMSPCTSDTRISVESGLCFVPVRRSMSYGDCPAFNRVSIPGTLPVTRLIDHRRLMLWLCTDTDIRWSFVLVWFDGDEAKNTPHILIGVTDVTVHLWTAPPRIARGLWKCL